MFILEVLNDGNEWEMIAEFFESAEDAELYYRNQLGDCFDEYRVTEAEEV
jgi:predicted PolB exonuclease-like 3'-5' exonuclease